MNELEFTGDEAAVANRIMAIDAQLRDLEQRTQHANARGLRGGALNGWNAHQVEDSLDRQRIALLSTRAELAEQLKRLVEGGTTPTE